MSSARVTVGAAGTLAPPQYFYGTMATLSAGEIVEPGSWLHPDVTARLDAGCRAAVDLRSAANPVGSSSREATVIAAIRACWRSASTSPPTIHVYRVSVVPHHVGPIAVLEELHQRLVRPAPVSFEALMREYLQPTGTWHVREVLAGPVTVLEEVPAASERETYLLRWVLYNRDLERASSL